MALLAGGIISGLAVGMLYSLLGFAVVLMYKCTEVANFAAGAMATFSVFIVYELYANGMSFGMAIAAGAVATAAIGTTIYYLIIRPNEGAGHLNLTIRTLGLYLLVLAFINALWAEGQPFALPAIFSAKSAFEIAGVTITWQTLGSLAVAAALAAAFAAFFQRTNLGLLFLALADRPDIARLLGVRTRRLTLTVWIGSSLIAMVVGLLVAPVSLVSSDMMEGYLLLAVSAAVIGGLNSLPGVFIGGAILGVLGNVLDLYVHRDVASLVTFGVLLAVLIARPSGLLGTPLRERL